MGYQVELTNDEIRDLLAERDGNRCMWQHCKHPIRWFKTNQVRSIDHKLPVSYCKEHGIDREWTNSLENLQLFHRDCNSIKGSLLPDDEGNYAMPESRERSIKEPRPEITTCCKNGRQVFPGEVCSACGSGAQPMKFPATMKKQPSTCSHKGTDFCFMCLLDFIPRVDEYDWRKLYD